MESEEHLDENYRIMDLSDREFNMQGSLLYLLGTKDTDGRREEGKRTNSWTCQKMLREREGMKGKGKRTSVLDISALAKHRV